MGSVFLLFCFCLFVAFAQTWQSLAPTSAVPPPRRSAGFLCQGTNLLVFGGRSTNARLNDFWRFNYETNAWTQLASAPTAAGGNSGSCLFYQQHQNAVWLMGGRNDAGASYPDVYSYSFATNTWQLELQIPTGGRFGMTCYQPSETQLCLYGGQTNNSAPALNSNICLDTQTRAWSTIAPLGQFPGARNDASDVELTDSEYMYLLGGNGTQDDALFVLNTRTMFWNKLATLNRGPSGRGDALMTMLPHGSILMQGGREGENGVLVDDATYVLDANTNTWSSSALAGPGQRWGAAGCTLPNYRNIVVMFGGVKTTPLNDMWIYNSIVPTSSSNNNTNAIAIAALCISVCAISGLILCVVWKMTQKQSNTISNV